MPSALRVLCRRTLGNRYKRAREETGEREGGEDHQGRKGEEARPKNNSWIDLRAGNGKDKEEKRTRYTGSVQRKPV